MQQFKKMPLFIRLVIIGAIPLALLGTILGALLFSYSGTIVRETEKTAIADTINRVDININVKARQLFALTETMAHSEPMEELIANYEGMPYDTKALANFCAGTISACVELANVTVFMGENQVYTTDETEGDLNIYLLRVLYEEARNYPNRVTITQKNQGLYDIGAGRRIFIIRDLLDEEQKVVGLFTIELQPSMLGAQMVTRQSVLDHQMLFITDRQGDVLFGNKTPAREFLNSMKEEYRGGYRKFYVNYKEEDYYVAAQYNALTGWTTYTAVRKYDLFPEARKLRGYTIATVCIATLIAILAMGMLSGTIARPIQRLTKGMREVENENYEVHVINDRNDEIGAMTNAFNSMVERIRYLIEQVYQEKLALKTAENKALQAQINPHFLYNALDSLNWMLIDRGELDISAMLVSLGKILQYAMNTKISIVSLQEELDNIQNYLQIQKMRLEDRLNYEVKVEPAVASFPLPKLTLQPLVENAIKYGVETGNKTVTVMVEARHVEGGISIVVNDDGAGMDEEGIQAYRALLDQEDTNGGSIGVYNAARRMQLHFNDKCRFTAHSHPQRGLRVEIFIPIEGDIDENTGR